MSSDRRAPEGQSWCPQCGASYDEPPRDESGEATDVCPRCETPLVDEGLTEVDGTPGVPLDGAVTLEPGDLLGGCEIEKQIGRGAMAMVYRARQLSLDRTVALKVLPPALSSTTYLVERFFEESSSLAALNHPNVVSIIDRGNEGKICYFVMEYVEGKSLSEVVEEGIDLKKFLDVVDQICTALHYAHRRKVVHRDVKPGNIMVDREGLVKVADFGLAGLVPALKAAEDESGGTVSVMGTPRYMSPEQKEAPLQVDGRSDIYSLGVLIYEFLAGGPPDRQNPEPASALNRRADPRLDPIVLKCLEHDPEQRYDSAEALREEIVALRRQLGRAPECPHCGTKNPVRFTECERCAHSLEDLFDRCANCGHKNRLDVRECLNCGMDLHTYRDERLAEVEELMREAARLRDEENYEASISVLKQVLAYEGTVFRPSRSRAEEMLKRIRKLQLRAAKRTFRDGQHLFRQQAYEDAIETWKSIPDHLLDVSEAIDYAREIMEEHRRIDRANRVFLTVVALLLLVMVLVLIVGRTEIGSILSFG